MVKRFTYSYLEGDSGTLSHWQDCDYISIFKMEALITHTHTHTLVRVLGRDIND